MIRDDKANPLPLKAPKPEARRRITALIYDCIARVDTGTGLLLDELEAAGVAANTLVVYATTVSSCCLISYPVRIEPILSAPRVYFGTPRDLEVEAGRPYLFSLSLKSPQEDWTSIGVGTGEPPRTCGAHYWASRRRATSGGISLVSWA